MKKPTNTAAEANDNPAGVLLRHLDQGTSRAIETQEADGQREFTESDTLPTRMRAVLSGSGQDPRAILEGFGVKLLGPVEGDALFQYVELPDGWSKVGTDHAMWSKLLDDQGRERASIFYKAAFYDRSAHLDLRCRFSVRKKYLDDWNSVSFEVFDGDRLIFATPVETVLHEPNRTNWTAVDEAERLHEKACCDWLLERGIDDPRNPAKYWDAPRMETDR